VLNPTNVTKVSRSTFFKVFLETTFVHVSCYPDHYEPKIFFQVSEVRTYIRKAVDVKKRNLSRRTENSRFVAMPGSEKIAANVKKRDLLRKIRKCLKFRPWCEAPKLSDCGQNFSDCGAVKII